MTPEEAADLIDEPVTCPGPAYVQAIHVLQRHARATAKQPPETEHGRCQHCGEVVPLILAPHGGGGASHFPDDTACGGSRSRRWEHPHALAEPQRPAEPDQEAPSALYLARRAQAKARDVRDGEIEIDGLIHTLDALAERLSAERPADLDPTYRTQES